MPGNLSHLSTTLSASAGHSNGRGPCHHGTWTLGQKDMKSREAAGRGWVLWLSPQGWQECGRDFELGSDTHRATQDTQDLQLLLSRNQKQVCW